MRASCVSRECMMITGVASRSHAALRPPRGLGDRDVRVHVGLSSFTRLRFVLHCRGPRDSMTRNPRFRRPHPPPAGRIRWTAVAAWPLAWLGGLAAVRRGRAVGHWSRGRPAGNMCEFGFQGETAARRRNLPGRWPVALGQWARVEVTTNFAKAKESERG